LKDHPLRNLISEVTIDSTGKQRVSWIGPASSENVLHAVFGVGKVNSTANSFDVGSDNSFYYPLSLPNRPRLSVGDLQLPPIRFAKRLFEAQYTYIGTIFSFVDPVAFEEQLEKAYRGPPSLSNVDDCLAYSKVLVILAFGQLYSVNQWDGFEGPPGFKYFKQALQFLPDLHEEPSILFVETLALIGYFMQNLNRRDTAFLYVGTALRMAISLALHHEVSSLQFSEAEKEHRRRVWWSVYSLDRILSVKSGNPIMIDDEDIGVRLPSRLPDEPPYCPSVVLRHYTELSRILSRIMIQIYRKTPKTGSSLMTSVQSIMSSLLQWHQDLPQELRFDPEKLNISRESVSTLVHYYQCINMTVRPLLFHVVQKRLKPGVADRERDWKEGLSATTVAVIETCISAAHDTVAMMTVAEKKNLLGPYALQTQDDWTLTDIS
jgi:proline utilization trans-activator